MNTKTQIFQEFKKLGVKPDANSERYIYNGLMCQYKDYEINFYHAGGSLDSKDYRGNDADNYIKFKKEEEEYLLNHGLISTSENFKIRRSIVKNRVDNNQLDLLDLIQLHELTLN